LKEVNISAVILEITTSKEKFAKMIENMDQKKTLEKYFTQITKYTWNEFAVIAE
jgi:hypothetical protein